jgi:hypothetical protein
MVCVQDTIRGFSAPNVFDIFRRFPLKIVSQIFYNFSRRFYPSHNVSNLSNSYEFKRAMNSARHGTDSAKILPRFIEIECNISKMLFVHRYCQSAGDDDCVGPCERGALVPGHRVE